jgi:hypothetical protein
MTLRIAIWPMLTVALFAIGLVLVVRFATLLVIDLIQNA